MLCTPLFLFPPYRHHHRFAPTAQCGENRPHHRFAPTAQCGENRPHHRFTPTAQCGKTALIIGLRQRRNAKKTPSSSVCTNGAMRKTAEERFHTLARGWLAYPVTSMHAQLPPKSGCRNPFSRLAILVLFDYFRNKMFYELHRCIIPHRFFDKRPRSHSRQRASR